MSEEDKYDVLEKIGHGSFGVIRKVRRKADGHVLCRKEISYVKMSQKEREQLQAELSILKELRHPNIVAYYEREHIKASQDLHLYMEYCGNGDLGQVINRLKLKNQYAEEEFVWSIFSQLVTALYRCHYGEDAPEAGRNVMGLGNNARPLKSKQGQYMILHRDLKPENVFLGADNSVKLGDFGLSKILQSHDFASTYVGTPFYMSPEICASERYTLFSDIWSLGCIIFELCAREPPFNAKTHFDLIQKIRGGRVAPLPHVYSPELQKVINSCLQVNPNLRPDTVQLLNLPIVKLMRKEQEVVQLGQQMKREKERAARAVKELSDKITQQEVEKAKLRGSINEELRKEWEIKAHAEIERQVQAELVHLQGLFETEVNKRVSIQLQSRSNHLSQPVQRSSTPILEVEEPAGHHNGEQAGQSTSTVDSTSDFASGTDLSSLSLESPNTSRGSFDPPKRRTRTPMTRAKTMFQQGVATASPADVPMVDPSPAPNAPISALSLSPRRQLQRNIFAAAERLESTHPVSPTAIPLDDEFDHEFDESDLPLVLPSPTRAKNGNVAEDPFKTLRDMRPRLTPAQHRLASTPNLTVGHKAGLRVRPKGTVPVIATSPGRKRREVNDAGSPVRKPNASAPTIAKDETAMTNSGGTLRSKKGSDELRGQTVRHQIYGRTLVELAQARAGSTVSDSEESAMKRAGGRDIGFAAKVAEWDPEKDEMPSPFLVKSSKGIRAGIAR